jgi:aryl-alcohol dehydrogenase-like predicted oxidoreductase
MEYRTLGRTGLRVSVLGFGGGNIGGLLIRGEAATQRQAVARALEAGINYFDTAAQYGDGRSEENLGRLLRELGATAYVGTKVRLAPDAVAEAPAALRRALEASLQRLGRDYVDIYSLHNAVALGPDPTSRALPVEAVCGPVAEGLQAVRAAGLARFIGFTGLGETAAIHQVVASGLFDTVQCYYNVLNPSAGYPGSPDGVAQDFAGLIDRAAAQGMGVLAIRVLAAGAITASPARHPVAGDPGSALAQGADYALDLRRAERLQPLVRELGLESPVELALRFALAKPGISTVLLGFSDPAQVEDALRWAARGPLPPAAVERLLAAVRQRDR